MYEGKCIRCDGELGNAVPPLSRNAIDLNKPPMVLNKKLFIGLAEMLTHPYVGKRKCRDIDEAVDSLLQSGTATIKRDRKGNYI